ncbi:MAG: DUF507 family protein [Candidatus Sumerlaeia bacterium]|nr:DUF507 family protein [Candidatus Sumerlaeia bacterium]
MGQQISEKRLSHLAGEIVAGVRALPSVKCRVMEDSLRRKLVKAMRDELFVIEEIEAEARKRLLAKPKAPAEGTMTWHREFTALKARIAEERRRGGK